MTGVVDRQWVTEFTRRVSAIALERREVLLGLGAVGLSATLPGCKSKPKPPPPPPVAPTSFETLRSLRELIRASPDHLSARAAEVIASKDFARAVRFVRDQVAVVPPSHGTDGAIAGVRWGPDATLRAAAGTQRERAELLRSMLMAMGASARLVYADRPGSVDAAALFAAKAPAFAVDLAKLPPLGSAAAAAFAHLNDPFPDPDSSAVAASLKALLPNGQAVAANPYDGLDTPVPVVEYTVNGTTRWAFALGAVDEVTAAPAGLGTLELSPASYPQVSVRLLASLGGLPGVPTPPGLVELTAGVWTADQLAGSRLLIATSNADPDQTVGAPADQVLLRRPTISVKQPAPLMGAGDSALWSPSAGAPAPSGATGTPITLYGAQFKEGAQAGDPPLGPYGPLVQLDPAAHAAALASVASVQAVANGGAFPDVQLTVSALDQGGAAGVRPHAE